MTAEELRRAVDDAAATASNWHIVGMQLQRSPAGPDDPIPSLVWAFQYMFYPLTESRREAWGPFAPVFEGPRDVFPPPLSRIEDRWLAVWADVAETSTVPIVRSRLHDLLWERRWSSRPDLHARHAIDAYLVLNGGAWASVDRAFCLIRALELARALKDEERLATVVSACVKGARDSMTASSEEPGVALRLIRALMWLPPDRQPSNLDDLLDQAARVYGGKAHNLVSVLDLKATRSGDTAYVRRLRVQQVERWRQEASEATGLLRFAHLQTALELARTHGLSEPTNQIRREMQQVDLGLKQVSTAVSLPTDQVEELVSAFVDETDWRCRSGDSAFTGRRAATSSRTSPL